MALLTIEDCLGGIGTTVSQPCPLNLGDVRMFTAISFNSTNPFAGADASAQSANMVDQLVWTAAQVAASPNNLYVSPKVFSNDFPLTHDEYAAFGHVKTEIKVADGVQNILFKIDRPSSDVATQLGRIKNKSIKFQMITKQGGLWHKTVTDGVQFPFFDSDGPCKVSSIEKTDSNPHSIEVIIPVKIDWFNGLASTASQLAPLDVTGITEVQERLINN